ncbi:MAG TPA: lysophospholipid acyltransferase family protein [Opitutaceae bacterium]|nr:lysophospholipid acyltransferase family protein [Opitutaceae bacterium]
MSRGYPQVEMTPVYGYSHAVIEILYDICFRGETSGIENFPTRGGYIIAANHVSHLDPPIVGLHCSRQICFFARKTLWKGGVASWWLDAVGCIPVDRDGGTDVAAIKRVLQALRHERVIILFPEGTRSPDGRLQPPKGGIGLLACRSAVPVVPARIFGSFAAFGKGGGVRLGTPVSVAYGRPLLPADYDRPEDGKERYGRAAGRIMAAIARLEEPRAAVI